MPRFREDTDPLKLERIIGPETDAPTTTTNQIGHRSGEGDAKRMRAIPVIAAGVPGTIPLTEGYAALHHKERMAAKFKSRRLHRA